MCGRWRCMNIGLAQHDIINNSWAASGPSGWMDDEWTWFVIVRAAGYWWCWVLGCSGGGNTEGRGEKNNRALLYCKPALSSSTYSTVKNAPPTKPTTRPRPRPRPRSDAAARLD